MDQNEIDPRITSFLKKANEVNKTVLGYKMQSRGQ